MFCCPAERMTLVMGKKEEITRIEKEITRVLTEYALDFSEKLTFETEKDFLYLSDTETYELYHISIADPKRMPDMWRDYHGKKCYEVLQGRNSPCPFCTNHLLTKEKCYVWEFVNPITKRNYILKDKLLDWHKKTVRLEVVMDVSDSKRVSQILIDNLENQNVLMSCIGPLAYGEDTDSSFEKMLQVIGEYYGVDLGAIYYFSHAGNSGGSYIWGEKNEMSFPGLQEPSPKAIAQWTEVMAQKRQVVLQNAESVKLSDPLVYNFFRKKHISSFCITPLFIGERLAGLICLDNIRSHWRDLYMLSTLSMYIAGQLQKRELAEENYRILYYDSVTKHPNFEWFKLEVAHILKENPQKKYSLWYCDLKNFKYINDVFGYDAGNRILKFWADFMAEEGREGEVFTRVSADNFTAVRWYENISELEERFQRMATKIAGFKETASKKYKLELVCGIYLMEKPGDALSLEEMINRANIAQKSVKNIPGSHLAFYSEPMRQKILDDMRMEAEMRDALKNGEFRLYLQPQVDTATGDLHRVSRAEALVRWQRKDKSFIMPGQFIPLFEKNGMIVELDLYMFEQACRYVRDNRRSLPSSMCISVNVSRISMLQPNFVENYCAMKEAYGLEKGTIELEFTESMAVENYEQFYDSIVRLKEHGFLCAMDDFGTGQSSLNLLKNLPIDVLKLDRLFFTPAQEPEKGQAVIASVLLLAKKLHMKTVAEGIEHPEQITMLKRLGCDYIQGYVYSRPIPAEQLRELLES